VGSYGTNRTSGSKGANIERGEALHIKLRMALGIGIPVVLGSALAVGVAAFPANATSYQDTALSASSVTDETLGVSGLAVTNGDAQILLSGTGVSSWSLNSGPSGVSVTGSAIQCAGCTATNSAQVVVDAKDSNGNAEALVISVVITADNNIQKTGTPTAVKVTNLTDTNNSNGTVTFSATTSASSLSYAESNLPTGLSSANPLTYSGGTAVPGTYTNVKATATDSDGAVLNGTFTLTVDGNAAVTSTYGDYVNKFGNGFDVYQQHEYAGALIAGWTATQADPATHFILNNGTHSGAVQIEYAPTGSGSGLCVSDPGGGWGSDPLPDGLILANCNTGPFQQFIRQSNGTLKNVATGLYVNPDGTGAQLRGESSTVSWGGAVYTWTAESSLPN
jgi:hypothetical protein